MAQIAKQEGAAVVSQPDPVWSFPRGRDPVVGLFLLMIYDAFFTFIRLADVYSLWILLQMRSKTLSWMDWDQ